MKLITKGRGIKGYKSMSEERLFSSLNESESVKEIEKNLFKLEKNISKLKKYYDYDDIEYKGIGDVINLINHSIDEDKYNPPKTNDGSNSNYIDTKVKEIRSKLYQLKNILTWSDHI